jgi:CheY-like chemotaxis protein
MSSPSRILLVDDNDPCRRALRQVLEGLGYVVAEADDGLEGLQLARTWNPDVAVVGLPMRVVDGFGVARRLRAALGDSVRLIALASPNELARALAAGFDSCLLEPVDSDAVLRQVQGGTRAEVLV